MLCVSSSRVEQERLNWIIAVEAHVERLLFAQGKRDYADRLEAAFPSILSGPAGLFTDPSTGTAHVEAQTSQYSAEEAVVFRTIASMISVKYFVEQIAWIKRDRMVLRIM